MNMFPSLFGGAFHTCDLVFMKVMNKKYWLNSGIIEVFTVHLHQVHSSPATCCSQLAFQTCNVLLPSRPGGRYYFTAASRFPNFLHLIEHKSVSVKSKQSVWSSILFLTTASSRCLEKHWHKLGDPSSYSFQ